MLQTMQKNYTTNVKFDEKYFIETGGKDAIEAMLEREQNDFLTRMNFLKTCAMERQAIMMQNLGRIEGEQMTLSNMLDATRVMWGDNRAEISTLEKAIFELQNQKRMERVSSWKDIFQIQKEMLVLMKEGQNFERMAEILD